MSGRERILTLIGLTGRAGAGKDTSADILREWYGFTQIAFADPLRLEIVDAFGVDFRLFKRDFKEVRTHSLAIGRCADPAFIARMRDLGQSLTAPRSPRDIMRWWGTEYRRWQVPDYWIQRMIERIDALLRTGVWRIVISDVRFDNEVACVRGLGGTIWRIRRAEADCIDPTHSSEKAIESMAANHTVENNGSLDELANGLAAALRAARLS